MSPYLAKYQRRSSASECPIEYFDLSKSLIKNNNQFIFDEYNF